MITFDDYTDAFVVFVASLPMLLIIYIIYADKKDFRLLKHCRNIYDLYYFIYSHNDFASMIHNKRLFITDCDRDMIDTIKKTSVFQKVDTIRFNDLYVDSDIPMTTMDIEDVFDQDDFSIRDKPSLTELSCIHSNLIEVSNLESLKELYVRNACLQKISDCPNIEILSCKYTQITELPQFLKLRFLRCNDLMTELNSYPNLECLIWSQCQLHELPYLPKIRQIKCNNSLIRTVYDYSTLVMLYLNDSEVESVHDLPNLKQLECSNSKLKSIKNCPMLNTLICPHNYLVEIPKLPRGVMIDVSYNKIDSLYDIYRESPNLFYLNLGYNPLYDILPVNYSNLSKRRYNRIYELYLRKKKYSECKSARK